MGTVSTSLPSDGQTIDASDVNTPINAILSEFNGNIDDNNIKTGANINGAKLGAGTTPLSKLDTDGKGGWIAGVLAAPNTVTYNGNRSYDVTFNTTDLTDELSNGMRLRLTRTVTPPTQCTDLEASSSQYWSKTSPTGISFTDDFTIMGWINPESYATTGFIVAKNSVAGTNGFRLYLNTSGQVTVDAFISAGNYKTYNTYQSVPTGKKIHVAATVDMSGNIGLIYLDGISVPVQTTATGTANSLTQAGNLYIGTQVGTTSYFDGKISQVAIFSSVLSASTIRSYASQTLTGAESTCVGFWDFNGDGDDANANANNLTASGGATATTVDSPFNATEYGIITANTFSTNTTLTVQVPEGYAIPTSGGVSAVAYSTQDVPYGFPRDKGKWRLSTLWKTTTATTSNATYGAYSSGGFSLTVPIGAYKIGYVLNMYNAATTAVYFQLSPTALTGGAATAGDSRLASRVQASSAATTINSASTSVDESLAASATYVFYTFGATTAAGLNGAETNCEAFAELAYV